MLEPGRLGPPIEGLGALRWKVYRLSVCLSIRLRPYMERAGVSVGNVGSRGVEGLPTTSATVCSVAVWDGDNHQQHR